MRAKRIISALAGCLLLLTCNSLSAFAETSPFGERFSEGLNPEYILLWKYPPVFG